MHPQVLKEAVRLASDEDSRAQTAAPEKTLSAQRIVAEVRSLAGRCEESAAAAAEGMDDGEELPECWQLIYRAALALAKAAAVDELLGNAASSMRAYHKVGGMLDASVWADVPCLFFQIVGVLRLFTLCTYASTPRCSEDSPG